MRPLVLLVAAGLLAACTATPAPTPTTPPVVGPPGPQPTSDGTVVAELLARPVRSPSVAAGAPCPRSPKVSHSPVVQPADAEGLGAAPIYPISFYIGDGTITMLEKTANSDGLYDAKVVWASSDDYEGPAVVRVARLDAQGRGKVTLSYNSAASRGDAVIFDVPAHPTDWPSFTAVSGPGCYAYQVDGVGFSESIYFEVRPGTRTS
jgi:hypothetical protein